MILIAGRTYAKLNLNSAVDSLITPTTSEEQPDATARYIDVTGLTPQPALNDVYDGVAFFPFLNTGPDAAVARVDAGITTLRAMTPAQARAWVQANVNSLADAKSLLSTMAAVLCVLARRL